MTTTRSHAAAWLALVLAGCGGGGAAGGDPDASTTPDVATSVCELPPGRLYLLEELHIAPYADGFDLDGDLEIDNEFGKMPSSVRNAVGAGYDGALQAGEWLIGTYIDGWTDPPTATDDEIGVHVLNVIDGDVPADNSNNHSGDAEFWAASLFLDLNCESTTRTSGALTDNVFRGTRERLDFPLNTGTGAVELVDFELEVTFDPDYGHAAGRVGAEITLCSLSGMPLPLPDETYGSALDFMVNDPSIMESTHIDVDLDGDGLEQVIGDGVGVVKCIDGDGTEILGRDCPCHPNIADAYSATLSFRQVSAVALGVR